MALEAAQRILPKAVVVPVHEDSWEHFTHDADGIKALFTAAGLDSRIVVLKPGDTGEIPESHGMLP
ncbi:hypothetical protein D2E59_23420 [Mycobacteroides abscessus]|uniref:Zn-dependent hydrolase n=1 Tax=Mycobacteroides abscessus TaxID=36809 RepID=A0ABD7HIM7_9MYCO|nr:hypothetical protein DDT46_15655 [Mycobacteroides abscessus]PVA77464.1 hypothetical protein DDJ37_01915 [Mycobacteroides abscessus]PVB23666.1 hypothetical protein DDJ71_01760 [Mycobacteroides abscessus]RIR48329.1 hypothetical protein D2E39_09910 [Mycobacteroides abscessus]RIR63394.1 hypothetical protein D2E62_17375 [Mycobacteroides abscessus]